MPTTTTPRAVTDGRIHVHPDYVAIWEEHVNQPAFKIRAMDPAIRFLRQRDWKVGEDPFYGKQRHSSISLDYRRAVKDGIEVTIEVSGRSLNFRFHAAGRRNKLGEEKTQGLPYLTLKRIELEVMRLTEHLADLHGYLVVLAEDFGDMTAEGRLSYARWKDPHRTPDAYSRTSADKHTLTDGQGVWVFDFSGRHLYRGTAHYNGNMWWVVLGKRWMENHGASDLYAMRPDPKVSAQSRERKRRSSLQRAIYRAVAKRDYARAAVLDRALFPKGVPVVRVRSKRDGLYWRPNSAGYTYDIVQAGLYPAHEFPKDTDHYTVEPA